MSQKIDYISLKEAAEMTGYTSDYIGQLIRSGKLPGKQIYSNVVWVTTTEAVLDYVQRDKKGKQALTGPRKSLWIKVLSPEGLSNILTVVGWTVVGLLLIALLFFAYIFAVSVDRGINAKYLEKVQHAR